MRNSEYIEYDLELKLNTDISELVDYESSIVNYKRGQTIVHEGDTMKSFFFIINGIVRGYYIDDKGEDITKCFSTINKFCGTEGFRTKHEATFTIECLDDCCFIKLPYSLIEKAINFDEKLKDKVNKLFLDEVTNLEERAKKIVLLNAEARYIDFCKQYPEIINKIELRYIASYIGVRPASLSRIRKNLKVKNMN